MEDKAKVLAKIYNSSIEKPLTEADKAAAKKFLEEKTNQILAQNNLVIANV